MVASSLLQKEFLQSSRKQALSPRQWVRNLGVDYLGILFWFRVSPEVVTGMIS